MKDILIMIKESCIQPGIEMTGSETDDIMITSPKMMKPPEYLEPM